MSTDIILTKYHGLGNDYIVVDPARNISTLNIDIIKRICDRHFGLGADGLLYGPVSQDGNNFTLDTYNPDGSFFEKSGNGLRIFARYIWDMKYTDSNTIILQTKTDSVTAIRQKGNLIRLEMGKADFRSSNIPVKGNERIVLGEKLDILGEGLEINCVSVGNPHCVIFKESPNPEEARRIGSQIEKHSLFPNKINVQFVKVIDRNTLQIEIWERGAGYTMASGTSSCAVAAVAHRLGYCDKDILVRMPGGQLMVSIDDNDILHLTGPVIKVFDGKVFSEAVE